MCSSCSYCIVCTVESPRSGQSRPNSVRISEFHLVSHAKPVKRTKFLLPEIRTLGRHVYEYHASFYRQFLLFFIMLNIFTITSINNICEYFVENHVRSREVSGAQKSGSRTRRALMDNGIIKI